MIALDTIRRIPQGHGFKQLAGRDQLPSFERDDTVRTMREVQIVSDVNGS